MTKRIILLGIAICMLLSSNFLAAAPAGVNHTSPDQPEITCELPGPSMVMVINPTQNTLTATWPHVPNAARYKITAKDLNTNIVVYSAIINANLAQPANHLITPLAAATPYEIGVSASECMVGDFGTPTYGYGQTDYIIVGDIIILSPCPPGGSSPFDKNGSAWLSIPLGPNGAGGLYGQACLVASATHGTFWSIQLNIAAVRCAPNRIKWIYEESNMIGDLDIIEQQTSGQLWVTSEITGQTLLVISNINADNGQVMTFSANITNSTNYGGSYKNNMNGCGNTTLSANPCTGGTQGKNAGPGNNGEVQIELESRSDFDNELPTEETIKALPNPFNDFTNIQYQISKQSPVSMVLFNAMGQVQRELLNDSQVEPGTYTLPVDMADLTPGVYFLTIQTESGRKITTVVKQ